MSNWNWNRISYVLFVLAMFSALVKVGGMTLADSGPMIPRIANAAPAVAEREPPWYMGTFLELEDDRGFVGEPPAEEVTPPNAGVEGDASESSSVRSEAPIFYRPSEPGEEPEPVCGNLSEASPDGRAVFPLARAYFASYSDTWGAPRPQGGHEGTDLMVPAGAPEYALTDGKVVAVSGSNENGWNTLGGYTVMIEASETIGPIKAGDLFYYAHLDSPSELALGSTVEAGQVVGRAGDTGQGPEVTSGLFPAHLHLGWYDGSGGRTEVDSGAMNPYPLLEWLKGNGGSVSGGSDAKYCEAPQTDGPKPSTGEDAWPTPSDPGQRPDLDTGEDHARPSPAIEDPKQRDEARDPEPPDTELGNPAAEADPDEDEGNEGNDGNLGGGILPDPEVPDDGVTDLPRIVDDEQGGRIGDISRRLRDGIRSLLPGLIPDTPDAGKPNADRPNAGKPDGGKPDGGKPDGGKDNDRGDDRKDPKAPGDRENDTPGNDGQRPDEGEGAALEGDAPEGDAPEGDGSNAAPDGEPGSEEGEGGGETEEEEPQGPETTAPEGVDGPESTTPEE